MASNLLAVIKAPIKREKIPASADDSRIFPVVASF